MDSLISCETKTSQETERTLQNFLEPSRKPKVIYTDNSFEIGKACEDLSCNRCTSTSHRSETNGIAEGAVRRIKEGTSAGSQDWMTNGVLIPRNAIAIYDMSKTSRQTGRLPLKDDLENRSNHHPI